MRTPRLLHLFLASVLGICGLYSVRADTITASDLLNTQGKTEIVPKSELSLLPEQTAKKYQISPEFTVAFPQPLMIGAEAYRLNAPDLRLYLDAGYFQYPLSISSLGIKALTIESGVRYFPFNSWFCLSLGLGYRNLGAQADVDLGVGDESTTASSLGLSTLYFSPMIEAKIDLTKRIGIAFGVGAQISLLSSGSMNFQDNTNNMDSSNSPTLAVDSFSYLNHTAGLLMPRVTLFRLLWRLE